MALPLNSLHKPSTFFPQNFLSFLAQNRKHDSRNIAEHWDTCDEL